MPPHLAWLGLGIMVTLWFGLCLVLGLNYAVVVLSRSLCSTDHLSLGTGLRTAIPVKEKCGNSH